MFRKWSDTPVSFTVELGREKDENGIFWKPWEDLTHEKELPLSVLAEISQLVHSTCEGLELGFDIRSSGYYDSGKISGPPEYCYPPEGEDERVCKGVDVLLNGWKARLSQDSSDLLEGLYQEEINSAELPEQDYDGPDREDG